MKLPTLYKKNKDSSIQAWNLRTDGAEIITEYGKMFGKVQSSSRIAKGKNIGRANETTPEDQAEMTARSMWTKKKDKGYFETIKEAEEEVVFLPMLAHELKEKMRAKLKFPVFIQPKMDGVRCLARWNGAKVQLLSRGGKEYNVPHLAEQLEAVIEPNQVLDGEIYIHGVLRQDINALVKKHRAEEYEETGYTSNDLQFWVYDTFTLEDLDRPFEKRLQDLSMIKADGKVIRRVFTVKTKSLNGLMGLHKSFTKHKGFEGTIIRLPDGKYELGHRSRALLKHKDFQDAEFKVVGFTEGEGKFVGCVIWVCETEDGKRFNVTPKGTLKQKQRWFSEAENFIGQEITVKFQSLSKDGIPEFPVGLGFRLSEDK